MTLIEPVSKRGNVVLPKMNVLVALDPADFSCLKFVEAPKKG
jgi:hypothetical protein